MAFSSQRGKKGKEVQRVTGAATAHYCLGTCPPPAPAQVKTMLRGQHLLLFLCPCAPHGRSSSSHSKTTAPQVTSVSLPRVLVTGIWVGVSLTVIQVGDCPFRTQIQLLEP